MASWTSGALKSLFGIGTDTKHWFAVKTAMEQAFGPIKIAGIEEGGKVRAFFATQTLIGDDLAHKTVRYSHPVTILDMKEATGSGRSGAAAIIDLWNKMTDLQPRENILQFKQLISHGEPHALYTESTYRNGQFFNMGQTSNSMPPARPDFIEKFLAEEKIPAMSKTESEAIFGPRPSGAAT